MDKEQRDCVKQVSKMANAMEQMTVVIEEPLKEIKRSARSRYLVLAFLIVIAAITISFQFYILNETRSLVTTIKHTKLEATTLQYQMDKLLKLIQTKSQDEEVLEQVEQIQNIHEALAPQMKKD